MILKREKEKNIGKEFQTICGICSWGQMDSKDALPFSEKNCLCLCIFEVSGMGMGTQRPGWARNIICPFSIVDMTSLCPCYHREANILGLTPAHCLSEHFPVPASHENEVREGRELGRNKTRTSLASLVSEMCLQCHRFPCSSPPSCCPVSLL